MPWQLQEAKQKFSGLARRTLEEGPQVVTRHGEGVVVLVPTEEYRRTSGREMDFKEFLINAPEGLSEIIPERPTDGFPREMDLAEES